MPQKPIFIHASEINEYFYCKRCWWKKINGFKDITSAMIAGTRSHNQNLKDINSAERKTFILRALLIVSIVIISLLLIIKFLVLQHP